MLSLITLRSFLFASASVVRADDRGETLATATPMNAADSVGVLDTATDADMFASITCLLADGTNLGSVALSGSGVWSVSGLPAWASAFPASGNGPASLQFTCQPNSTGAPRTASFTAGGVRFTSTQPAAALHLDGPGLTIVDAVILTLQTIPGTSYLIESSADLSAWTSTGIIFIGNGTVQSVALPRNGTKG